MQCFVRQVQGESVVIIAPGLGELPDMSVFEASSPLYGLDVETTGVNEKGAFDPEHSLRLVQIGTRDTAYVLRMDDPEQRRYAAAFLADESRHFVGHTMYDPLWIRREFGIRLGERALDTWITSNTLEPGELNDHGLKGMSERYIDSGLTAAQAALHARFKEIAPVGHRVGKKLQTYGWRNIDLEDEAYLVYAGLDTIYVRRLWDILLAKLGTRMHSHARDQQCNQWSADWQWRGMKLDLAYTTQKLGEVESAYQEADERLAETFGFSPRSPKRAAWLAERGVKFTKFTDTGRPTLDKKVIPLLASRYESDPEVGPVLRDMETLSGLSNTMANLRKTLMCADADGVVRPSIKVVQAKTGRMSATYPAVQTLSKTSGLRRCYMAPEGWTFVSADLDQVEIRVAAAYSRDPNLLAVVLDGKSMHDLTAEAAYGPGFTKAQRAVAKTVNFASQYGAGPRALAEQAGVTEKEAKRMLRVYRETYSVLEEFGQALGEQAVVINDYGRQTPRDDNRPYASLNYLIQGTGRDILHDCIARAYERGIGDYIVLPIHDELLLCCPENEKEEVMAKLQDAMCFEFRGIPILAESEHLGKYWGQG